MFWVLFVKKTFLHCLGRRTCLHIVCEEDYIDRESFHTCLAVCLSSIICPYISFCLYVHHNTYSVMPSLLATTDSGVFQKSCFWNLSDECKVKGQSKALVVIQQFLLKMVGAHLPWKEVTVVCDKSVAYSTAIGSRRSSNNIAMNKKNLLLHLRVHWEEDKSSSSHQQILARTKDEQSSNWWQQHLAFSYLSLLLLSQLSFQWAFYIQW